MNSATYEYPQVHEIKTHPRYFQSVASYEKSFEVRKNDRDYKEGDYLLLLEWNPETEQYTGNERTRLITYVLKGGQLGIDPEYVVMSII